MKYDILNIFRPRKPTLEVDDRMEKIFDAAKGYCHDSKTGDLVAVLQEEKGFPELSGMAIEDPDVPTAYQSAYDITMFSFALLRRPDLADHLTVENMDHVTNIIHQSQTAVEKAIKRHKEIMKQCSLLGMDKPPFLSVKPTSRNLFNRMILFHAVPEHYDPEAAPQSYMKALDYMADFWGFILKGGDNAVMSAIFSRWAKGGNKEDFNAEFTQLIFTPSDLAPPTEEQIDAFKEGLKLIMLKTGGIKVSMERYVGNALNEALAVSGITSYGRFPIHTETFYDDGPDRPCPCVIFCSGRSAEPLVVPVEEQTEPERTIKAAEVKGSLKALPS
ncbi:MAG: hypothetical protein P4M13_09130 [Alphaproteobacteria bacterium]|nr:hypothetical protein [Alphaproteobacteria bacterium]